ncbi:hypothetical protein [Bordetella genomosp. 10]|uniref:hypothetical protein n=1 Tax=Bordetella genomosp. 10 TaxID=1416804 RepID=UPI0015C5FB02|nr:hypothetical protein [Bordetella genomosp. 10]
MSLGARSCQRGAWIRLPAGDIPPDLAAGAGGATVYLKQSAAAMFAGLSLD